LGADRIRQPLLNSRYVVLGEGADSRTMLVTRHAHSEHDSHFLLALIEWISYVLISKKPFVI
jgi:hypothetical protein